MTKGKMTMEKLISSAMAVKDIHTLQELATTAKLPYNTIKNAYLGKNLTIKTIKALEQALGITAQQIVDCYERKKKNVADNAIRT